MYTLPGNKQEAKADLVNNIKPKTAIVKTKTCQITGAPMCIAIFNVWKCVAKCGDTFICKYECRYVFSSNT